MRDGKKSTDAEEILNLWFLKVFETLVTRLKRKKWKKNAERSAHSQIIDFFFVKRFLWIKDNFYVFSPFLSCSLHVFWMQCFVQRISQTGDCFKEKVIYVMFTRMCVASIRFCHKMRNLLCYSLPFLLFFFANSIIAFTFLSRHWIVNTVDGTGDKIIYNNAWQLGVCVAADRVDSSKMLLA